MARAVDEDELIEHWTLVGDQWEQVAGKRGSTRLGFSLVLKFYGQHGRFPRGRSELPDEAIAYLGRQVEVPAADLGFYQWDGRTFEYHRAQVRRYFGFRECTVSDADKLTTWLAEGVCLRERRVERVRAELVEQCRRESIEPPTTGRIGRIVGSALQHAEQTLTVRVAGRIPADAAAAITALIAEAPDHDGAGGDDVAAEGGDGEGVERRELFARIRAVPGGVSLKTIQAEIGKLRAIRAVGLPAAVFADIAPAVVAAWGDRAAVEAPSHLRRHPEPVRLTLLAALLHGRGREITDALVELLIACVHRISAHAESKVVEEFVADLKRVSGKENILFRISEAAIEAPEGLVHEVVYPAAGGADTLRSLVAEYKAKGTTFRQHKQRVFKASYTNHYRAGLVELLEVLEFRSTNATHRPVLDALELITRYRAETTNATRYYALDEAVPVDGVLPADLAEVLYRSDKRGRARIQRTVYECGVLQTLRERLRCKEIWVVGADRWRNPDEDLPQDFEDNRAANYAELRKPLDADTFVAELAAEMRAELAALDDTVPRVDWLQIVAGRKQGEILLSPYQAAPEPRNLRRLKAAVQARWGTVPLLDMLTETCLRTGALAAFTPVGSRGDIPAEALAERLLLLIYAYGTNTGIRAVAAGDHPYSEDDLRYVRRRYLTVEGAREVARAIANATFAARQPWLWGQGT